ncbi:MULTISPECIES: hypothetical protein [unclassified Nodularia (in: cyanobacteria)]|uniref:hypothetical protein n=1 Tax=unclassified Nodularia (in: cyanobacteria) TaxID=2656917 RepID=UPI001880A91C|nr:MULTISPECIES: hypothetical protein [unclassified Nodularia (in: cyanobacteria)]MBE9202138.1 hypothetical protein [Nodularia sp. LEGE 06071]MCC2696075.1 hypothetical protein [Nodularia sp. LEGE 04288]
MTGIAEREGRIWVPDDEIDLLSVDIDFDATGEEFDGMIGINKAGREWLQNQISLRDYCDKLQLFGIPDPYQLVGEFCDHTELIMRAGL